MKKVLVVFAVVMVLFSKAQITDYQKLIDSISQKRWDSTALDIDSLSNPKIIDIRSLKKDSVQLTNNMVIVSNTSDTSPLTPSSIINLPTLKRWFFFGQNSLVFNQSSFANWYAGGNNNIGVIGKVNYNIVYKKNRHYMDNNIQMGYGFVSSTGQSTRKTDDYINIMTNYGYELAQHYYLSTGFQFLSQFTPGFNYANNPDPVYDDRISKFMAPGYLNLGIGVSYNPNENFQVIFRPVNGKFTFVLDKKLQFAGNYGLERDGQSMRSELGAMVNVLYKIKLFKDVNFVNQVNFFSNYLQHSERVDINYSGSLNLKFNKYITTVITYDMVYDHDQIKRLQRKQTLGVGVTYNLGYKMERDTKTGIIKPFVN
ncbi:DUF3078 domain-containing protein [Epilithonimonas xixisoli]|uniref:DUF3078 domain-containing protein n=1 Tax=Epilithonimonas xixisoli TaxID=1476462 RepID=A0A4R8I7P9_9FLAO|nr:DUF3078 domain-containing protein [Epilithonimonas xixisoli]TDX84689.1 Protein of unknown function (DUF3078) [Epilithonimonas xixisoli]